MESQNVTVAIPKTLLRKIKLIAVQRQSSLSGLLREALMGIAAREDQYERARRKHAALLDESTDLGTRGRAQWTREGLHDR